MAASREYMQVLGIRTTMMRFSCSSQTYYAAIKNIKIARRVSDNGLLVFSRILSSVCKV